jgi:hypothetical protein
MKGSKGPLAQSTTQVARRWLRAAMRSPLLCGITVLLALVLAFYAVENWRGKSAWERCRKGLRAKGAPLDWEAFIPAEVPEEDNFYQSQGFKRWQQEAMSPPVLAGNATAAEAAEKRRSADFAQVVVVPLGTPPSTNADVNLELRDTVVSLASTSEPQPVPCGGVIPLIVMDDVPMQDAIRNLAKQMGSSYSIDPKVIASWTELPSSPSTRPFTWFRDCLAGRGRPAPPRVSIRFENVTAFQALEAILSNYGLTSKVIGGTHLFITARSANAPLFDLRPDARERIRELLARQNSAPSGPLRTLAASQGFTLYVSEPGTPQAPTARIEVRAPSLLSPQEVEALFPPETRPWNRWERNVRALQTETNSFRVFVAEGEFISASDYLDRTEHMDPVLEQLRKDLKRPFARMGGNFQNPAKMEIPNFVGARVIAQTLCQRAQAHLLLNEPDLALEELTLLDAFCPKLRTEPRTLVAAMVEVAVRGIYVKSIQDGIRMGVWRPSQLRVLQEQLGSIELPSTFLRGLECERAATCRTIETSSAKELAIWGRFPPAEVSFPQELADPVFRLAVFGPRGWRYQAMTAYAFLREDQLACYDCTRRTLDARCLEKTSAQELPRTVWAPLAQVVAANLLRAWKAMAENQNTCIQGQIACALERYRLENSNLPENLESLQPAFLARVPQDIVGGQPFRYTRVDSAHYHLYSVGWDEKDDGGNPGQNKDWVWN